jgi:hypothetical protein
LLGFILSRCGGSDSSFGVGSSGFQHDPSRTLNIIAFGNSIGDWFPTNLLTEVGRKPGVRVINFSVFGLQTTAFVGRITAELKVQKPTHFLVLLGINNVNGGDVAVAVSKLQSMVDDALTLGVVPIMELPHRFYLLHNRMVELKR